MSSQTHTISEDLRSYLRAHSRPLSPLQQRLRAETAQLEWGRMQISAEQGQLMGLLVRLLGARRCLEVGTFTGYSALMVAEALPPDGRLICCDISEEYTAIARRYWAEAGVADRIELHLGPASESLAALLAAGGAGQHDFAFIDADKPGYPDYFEKCLELLRPGGLVAVDNIFMGGGVLDEDKSTNASAMDAFNQQILADDRVEFAIVPIGDGLTLARKL